MLEPTLKDTLEGETALKALGIPFEKNAIGLLLVRQSICLAGSSLRKLPNLSAVVVDGSFDCSDNHLETLEGAPHKVSADFLCNNNKLVTLKGAPKEIKGSFSCWNNNLETLEGAPDYVRGWFNCSRNKLWSLYGSPAHIGEYLICPQNALVSLDGYPLRFKELNSDFGVFNDELPIPESTLNHPRFLEYAAKKRADAYAEKICAPLTPQEIAALGKLDYNLPIKKRHLRF